MRGVRRRKTGSCIQGLPPRGSVILLCLSLLVLIIVPAAALVSSFGPGIVKDPAGFSGSPAMQEQGAGISRISAAAGNTPAVRPTPTVIPGRQNRTSIIQTIAKNAAERPKVTVPAFWFIFIVAIAFIGIGAVLYLLLRRKTGSSAGLRDRTKPLSGNPTVIGTPATPENVGGKATSYPQPAVPFPPSLAKRFHDPVLIGEGGLARVFSAKNAKTQQTVAVKIPVRYDEITGTHFTKDIVFWQGLEHKNIIRIHSFNILPVPYIEMEYAPSSLSTIALPLPEEKAVGLILGIARGLAYAHRKGILHRDIKPENILLDSEGTPKITDWGLGRVISDPRQSSMIGYSPSYAAPEQIAPQKYGRPGPATDIYQLGMLLYEMLTGSVAFEAEGMHDLNLAILNDPPALLSWNGVHEEKLKEIILKCLAKRPEERYFSVDDLIRDLESISTPQ